jgi:hypothetical protein
MASTNQQLAERDKTIANLTDSLEQARRRAKETQGVEQYEAQLAELQRTLDQLSQPQLNVPIEDLYPQELTREQVPGKTVTTIEVPSSSNSFALILHIGDQPSYPEYTLEILDQHSKDVWRGSGLQKSQEEKSFSVSLSRRLMPAGLYQIKLYGLRGGQKHPVENYVLRIQYR